MKYEKTSIGLLILFCTFLYPVMIKGAPILSYTYQYGIPLLYLIFNIRALKKVKLKQIIVFFFLILMVMLSIIYPVLHSTNDYTYVKEVTFIFRKVLIYIFLILVLSKKVGPNTDVCHFMYYYALTHAIFVIGTLLLVLVPGLKAGWFSVFNQTIDSSEFLKSYGYTFRIGWTGFAGFRLTVHCTWSCIFLLYLFYAANEQYKLKQSNFLITYALCFLGNMFYGRSGLVMSIVCTILGILIWNRKHFFRLLEFIGIAIGLLVIIYMLRNVSVFSNWYVWMSTPILNFIKTGDFQNYSFNHTRSMVWMPKFRTIILGDGRFTDNGLYYMQTDSGIMRNILFWGIIGAVISYGLTILTQNVFRVKNVILWLLILITFLAFEYKGDVYYEYIALAYSLTFIENAVLAFYYPDIWKNGISYCRLQE